MLQAYEVYTPGGVQLHVRAEDASGNGVSVQRVDVFWHSAYGQDPTAEVNWSACGSVEPEIAHRYAKMLERAACLADSLNAANGALLPTRGQGSDWRKVELW